MPHNYKHTLLYIAQHNHLPPTCFTTHSEGNKQFTNVGLDLRGKL